VGVAVTVGAADVEFVAVADLVGLEVLVTPSVGAAVVVVVAALGVETAACFVLLGAGSVPKSKPSPVEVAPS